MEMTLRWYGSKFDTVTLEQIRQIPGVTGVITTLYDILLCILVNVLWQADLFFCVLKSHNSRSFRLFLLPWVHPETGSPIFGSAPGISPCFGIIPQLAQFFKYNCIRFREFCVTLA